MHGGFLLVANGSATSISVWQSSLGVITRDVVACSGRRFQWVSQIGITCQTQYKYNNDVWRNWYISPSVQCHKNVFGYIQGLHIKPAGCVLESASNEWQSFNQSQVVYNGKGISLVLCHLYIGRWWYNLVETHYREYHKKKLLEQQTTRYGKRSHLTNLETI